MKNEKILFRKNRVTKRWEKKLKIEQSDKI
jgi:hypothetical protein